MGKELPKAAKLDSAQLALPRRTAPGGLQVPGALRKLEVVPVHSRSDPSFAPRSARPDLGSSRKGTVSPSPLTVAGGERTNEITQGLSTSSGEKKVLRKFSSEQAATLIQSRWRGIKVRRNYAEVGM
jgi:hypothetical protein